MDNVFVTPVFGYVKIITTQRCSEGKLILGGYAIHYDLDGREVSRTEDTPNVVVSFDG